ncbi:MAG: hypothetical protein ACQEQF_12935 [Bacillota bacterium]
MAKNNSYSETSLKKGIEIEREHSNNPYFQEKIAKEHLSENKDYYKYSGNGKEYLVSENNKEIFCNK